MFTRSNLKNKLKSILDLLPYSLTVTLISFTFLILKIIFYSNVNILKSYYLIISKIKLFNIKIKDIIASDNTTSNYIYDKIKLFNIFLPIQQKFGAYLRINKN